MQRHGGGKRASQKHVESKTTSQLSSFDALSNWVKATTLTDSSTELLQASLRD